METLITPDQLSTSEVIANPYPAYRQLRDQSPFNFEWLAADGLPGLEQPLRAWALLKYDDVYGALRDHETFSSTRPAYWTKVRPHNRLLEDDPPSHTQFRRLVNKAFTLRRIEALTPWITDTANELLDDLGPGENDLVQGYTIPLPVRVIARLLGIPGEQRESFKRWSDSLISFVKADKAANRRNIQEMMTYFGKMAITRQAHGAEDLITGTSRPVGALEADCD